MSETYEVPGWSKRTSREVSKYLKYNRLTSLISPTYLAKVSLKPYHLLIAVHSLPGHRKRRRSIRKYHGGDCQKSSSCDLIFILGRTCNISSGNEIIETSIRSESDEFNDILLEDFLDSYNNLTLKSLFMLKHFVDSNDSHPSVKQFTHLMKIDDDCFLNLDTLGTFLMSHALNQSRTDYLFGLESSHVQPRRTLQDRTKLKWLMPSYMYNQTEYPPYMNGGGYLMTRRLAECLIHASLTEPLIHLEDVYLTGICAQHCPGIDRISPREGLSFSQGQHPVHLFEPDRDIIVHPVDPGSMGKMHRILLMERRATRHRVYQDKKVF